ncbi:hypothetical protein AVEN_238457-1 [Araneus ventricosus]|uniref:Uncharacterized protein n=1 Tax=Araneus ventricosus TaxID=182803 RepID=A0A4Y2LEX5_ARAVE|nr:hypothetical protein AVEN_238457-1 [Araneus ventricosus]
MLTVVVIIAVDIRCEGRNGKRTRYHTGRRWDPSPNDKTLSLTPQSQLVLGVRNASISLAPCVSTRGQNGGEFQTETLRDDAIGEGFVGPFLNRSLLATWEARSLFPWENLRVLFRTSHYLLLARHQGIQSTEPRSGHVLVQGSQAAQEPPRKDLKQLTTH